MVNAINSTIPKPVSLGNLTDCHALLCGLKNSVLNVAIRPLEDYILKLESKPVRTVVDGWAGESVFFCDLLLGKTLLVALDDHLSSLAVPKRI
jgi:hypothetical protein